LRSGAADADDVIASGPMGPKGEIRNPFVSLLLTGVTCGLYGWYWWFKMASEVNTFLGTNRMNIFKIWGLTAVTCGLYGFYYMFVEGKNIIKEVQAKAGQPEDPPLICDLARMQGRLNSVWEKLP
jgi:hypothetical protein